MGQKYAVLGQDNHAGTYISELSPGVAKVPVANRTVTSISIAGLGVQVINNIKYIVLNLNASLTAQIDLEIQGLKKIFIVLRSGAFLTIAVFADDDTKFSFRVRNNTAGATIASAETISTDDTPVETATGVSIANVSALATALWNEYVTRLAVQKAIGRAGDFRDGIL